MSSTYPAPPASTPSLAVGAGASTQEIAIDRASQLSPQLGQGPPGSAYQQSQQEPSTSPHQQLAAHQAHHYQSHLDNGHASSADLGAEAAAAVAAAHHHGLEVLQAATIPHQTGAQSTSQYPPPPALHGETSYQMPSGSGTPMQPKHQNASKATRLRRACDMCSARKVKVSYVLLALDVLRPGRCVLVKAK
jgi:hypothetical protein